MHNNSFKPVRFSANSKAAHKGHLTELIKEKKQITTSDSHREWLDTLLVQCEQMHENTIYVPKPRNSQPTNSLHSIKKMNLSLSARSAFAVWRQSQQK